MLIFWLKEKFEKFKNCYTFFQLLLFYIHGSPLCIPFNYNNNNNKRSIQLFFLFFEIYIKLQESRIRSTIYSPETKSPSQEEKKNYEAKYDNQNLNNENYHRLNHIVKKPFNPTRLERPPFSQEIHTHTNLSNWHFSGCTPRFPPRFSVYTAMTKQDYR